MIRRLKSGSFSKKKKMATFCRHCKWSHSNRPVILIAVSVTSSVHLPRCFLPTYFVPEDSLAATTDTWQILTEALIFRNVKSTIAGRPILIDYI